MRNPVTLWDKILFHLAVVVLLFLLAARVDDAIRPVGGARVIEIR